jgi:hypothetical protein
VFCFVFLCNFILFMFLCSCCDVSRSGVLVVLIGVEATKAAIELQISCDKQMVISLNPLGAKKNTLANTPAMPSGKSAATPANERKRPLAERILLSAGSEVWLAPPERTYHILGFFLNARITLSVAVCVPLLQISAKPWGQTGGNNPQNQPAYELAKKTDSQDDVVRLVFKRICFKRKDECHCLLKYTAP